MFKKQVTFEGRIFMSYILRDTKKGDMVTVYLQDEDIDNHPLFAIWEISRIDFPFNNPPYVLLSDINEIYEDMDELQELINKKVTGTSE